MKSPAGFDRPAFIRPAPAVISRAAHAALQAQIARKTAAQASPKPESPRHE